MKALGMIEVYGYLAAVEALDSALKAANVELVQVTKVQGGLVSVLVTGDVGATKAAMDASAAAAERVGQVISVHVIPRPAPDIETMVKGRGAPPKKGPTPPPPKAPAGSNPPAPSPAKATPPVEAPKAEAPKKVEAPASAADVPSLEEMRGMSVVNLRNLARHIGITSMTRREIRDAKKGPLVEAIQRHLEQER